MAEEGNSSSGFKVVDRRPFAADGSRKQEFPAEERERAVTPERERAAAPERERSTPRAPQGEDRRRDNEEPSRFETLVSYLSTTAMFQMGLIPGPAGERIPSDLPNAQRTIDLLETLQEKTQGNLTGSESRLLDDVLYELRMSFVEVQKRQARKSK